MLSWLKSPWVHPLVFFVRTWSQTSFVSENQICSITITLSLVFMMRFMFIVFHCFPSYLFEIIKVWWIYSGNCLSFHIITLNTLQKNGRIYYIYLSLPLGFSIGFDGDYGMVNQLTQFLFIGIFHWLFYMTICLFTFGWMHE